MNVVVVESPAKAKTINKYPGRDYKVIASYGHVRDLPAKDGSVLPDSDFAMSWEVDGKSDKHLKEIVAAVRGADRLFLATDPDREGETISWHVREVLRSRRALKKDTDVKRVVFNEVTKSAVIDAFAHPRDINQELVDAYLARRALDYLVGFTLSPVLWRKLPGSRSAGRVQSVALRLICEREAEIEAFKPRGERRPVMLESGLDAPIFLRAERLDLALAVDDQAQRDRLDAAGRLGARQLAPQHRRQGESDQVVERPARQIGIDQLLVDLARVVDGVDHGALGDFVERHALDRQLVQQPARLQRLDDVPGNRLAFAIRVGRQDQLVGALDRVGDFLELLLAAALDFPIHEEVVLRLHRTVLGRQVTHVAERGQDAVVPSQVLVDRLGFGRGFDDDDFH